jgi:hypothetical protein
MINYTISSLQQIDLQIQISVVIDGNVASVIITINFVANRDCLWTTHTQLTGFVIL